MSCQHKQLEAGKCTNPDCDYCLHEVKFGGLCAVCGSIVEEDTNDAPADHIKISHKDNGITVSLNEAKRLEKQDEQRLLKEKKLSLIVDLDQTILHATWEPYIADWVKDKKKYDSNAVKDISQFTLDGSPLVYSIKLRPELSKFLKSMSQKYEMHIYTMGTRSYAEAVVKEIDADGKLFQDRILSRDENGSMTKKRLERLFPSDSSKVVVLDDRADVWDYTPNLIQIKPYEYFIGIGDINSPFAQPKKDIIPSTEVLKSNTPEVNVEVVKEKESSAPIDEKKEITAETTAETTEEDDIKEEKDDIYSDTEDDDVSVIPSQETNTSENNELDKVDTPLIESTTPNVPKNTTQLPNTHDNDRILNVIEKALNDVHNVYFNDLKRNQKPDVAIILNSLKAKVLKGCTLVFSGVIPLQQRNPEESWIWRMATSFGANCVYDLTGKVTHLIAANPGTSKVNSARKHGNIKIVSPAWITNSVWNWKKQEEEKYLLSFTETSPEEPEIENPESTPLELGFNWEDDEVDAILDDDEDDDSGDEEDFGSSLNQSQEVGDKSKERIDSSDDDDDDDESFLADMDAILDSDGEENGEQEYGDSNDEEITDDEDESNFEKRDRDGDNEEEPSFKKRK